MSLHMYLLSYKTCVTQVDCDDLSTVFARCFPTTLLHLFMDDFPFCDFKPLYAVGSNRRVQSYRAEYCSKFVTFYLVINDQ